jgi:hypothetical protein
MLECHYSSMLTYSISNHTVLLLYYPPSVLQKIMYACLSLMRDRCPAGILWRTSTPYECTIADGSFRICINQVRGCSAQWGNRISFLMCTWPSGRMNQYVKISINNQLSLAYNLNVGDKPKRAGVLCVASKLWYFRVFFKKRLHPSLISEPPCTFSFPLALHVQTMSSP